MIESNLKISGLKLYEKNSFYRNLVNVMEYPDFISILDRIETQDDFKTVLMFMKVYRTIGLENPGRSCHEKICIVDRLFKTRESRSLLAKEAEILGSGFKKIDIKLKSVDI